MSKLFLLCICIGFCSFSMHSQILIGAQKNDKWGFVNSKGKWKIQPQFDSVGTFYNGYAEIYKFNPEQRSKATWFGDLSYRKDGLINLKGTIILQPIYGYIGRVENDRISVMLDNEDGTMKYFNVRTLSWMEKEYWDAEEFGEGLAAVTNDDDEYGFIDTTGKLVIPYQFDIVYSEFEDGVATVRLSSDNDTTYYINKKGEIIGHDTDSWDGSRYHQLLDRLHNKNPEYGSEAFDRVKTERNGMFWYRNWSSAGWRYGLADTTGKIIILPTYKEVDFSGNISVVELDGKYGYIFHDGSVAIPFEFEDGRRFWNDMATVKQNGKWGVINKKGKWILKPKFQNLHPYFSNE